MIVWYFVLVRRSELRSGNSKSLAYDLKETADDQTHAFMKLRGNSK